MEWPLWPVVWTWLVLNQVYVGSVREIARLKRRLLLSLPSSVAVVVCLGCELGECGLELSPLVLCPPGKADCTPCPSSPAIVSLVRWLHDRVSPLCRVLKGGAACCSFWRRCRRRRDAVGVWVAAVLGREEHPLSSAVLPQASGILHDSTASNPNKDNKGKHIAQVYESAKRWGPGDCALIEIAYARSSEELLAARKAYHVRYKRSIEEDVATHAKGDLRKKQVKKNRKKKTTSQAAESSSDSEEQVDFNSDEEQLRKSPTPTPDKEAQDQGERFQLPENQMVSTSGGDNTEITIVQELEQSQLPDLGRAQAEQLHSSSLEKTLEKDLDVQGEPFVEKENIIPPVQMQQEVTMEELFPDLQGARTEEEMARTEGEMPLLASSPKDTVDIESSSNYYEDEETTRAKKRKLVALRKRSTSYKKALQTVPQTSAPGINFSSLLVQL
ncbi:Annexin D1 [Platanthera zijinensis]|uniref:Annexin D1 n=1 Tax=Platanthera zijinensis TaxID=2320716 RepID=A0AAP0B153_9ASPA